jgi:hypothetical protein
MLHFTQKLGGDTPYLILIIQNFDSGAAELCTCGYAPLPGRDRPELLEMQPKRERVP